uniref:Uncharacterized protein n=1 Tax=Panagrolaimus sp. PS1159 TaxID=55785 RepID=A0AC35GUW5_9BILA
MLQCWDENPKNPPIFGLIKVKVKQIYDDIKKTATNCLNTSIEISNTISYIRANTNPNNDIKPYPNYSGQYIFIKGSNGKLMSGENGLRPLKCDRKEPNVWEMFTIENFGNGIIALKSKDRYVSSENGEKPITCDRKIITETEKFEWIDNFDGTFSLKGNNEKFLSRDNGEGLMICDRDVNGIFEKFRYIDYTDIPFVERSDDTHDSPYTFIKGSNGKYVCS